MIPAINTAYIFSELGNSASLLPMAIKDVAHSSGMTTASYINGDKAEGKDRFIDEVGAAVIWLGGLPFFKKVIDKTLYKFAKHNPDVDIRLLKNKEIIQKAIKFAPTQEIAKSIEHASKNEKHFKALFMAKFIASTVFTLGAYAALTIFRHKHTEKTLIKEIKKEQAMQKAKDEFTKAETPVAFQSVKNNQKEQSAKKNPSFGMNLSGLSNFMFNPVKNMMIVDGGITAERLGEARNPQDFIGYVIKEGSFWAFMYFAGPKIQEFFENVAEKKHNKSIGLDMRALQDAEFNKSFKEGTVSKAVDEFNKILKMEKTEKVGRFGKAETVEKILNPEEVYEFICTKHDNLVVKMAKKSGIIKTMKHSNAVDTQAFIDINEVKGVSDKLKKLTSQFELSGENAEHFMKKVVSLKRGSVLKNIISCMGVLGLVVPGMMILARYMDKDNKGFQVKAQLQEKLNNNMLA